MIRPIIDFTNPMMIGAEDNGWVDPDVTDCGDLVLVKPCLELGSHTCGRLRLQGSHMFYYVFMEAVDLKMITNNFNSMILRLVGLLFSFVCLLAAVTQEQSKMALRKQKLMDVASESQKEEDSQEDEAADEQVKKRERPE